MLTMKLAYRNLFRNVRRTLLTCLLISSSLIALILVDGLVLGMFDVMVGGATRTLEGEAQVYRDGFRENLEVDLTIDDPAEVMAALEGDDAVMAAAPRVIVGGMVASSYNTCGGLIYGVDHKRELAVSRIRDAIVEGQYLSGGEREILIGIAMANQLEVKLGDRIVITAAAVDTNEIAQELFRVSGVFEFGPDELDESFVFINLSTAQQLLGMTGRLHQVAVRFREPDMALNNDLHVYSAMNDRWPGIVMHDWIELQPAMGAMIDMSGFATGIVAVILFLLTSLGVINSMFMSIYERIYEFGVAKAIGTTPIRITALVLMEALLIALLSSLIGILLGLALNYYFSIHGIPMGEFEVSGIALTGNIRTEVALYQYLSFPLYVTALTVVAAIYPAIFAARIVPTQALQRAL